MTNIYQKSKKYEMPNIKMVQQPVNTSPNISCHISRSNDFFHLITMITVKMKITLPIFLGTNLFTLKNFSFTDYFSLILVLVTKTKMVLILHKVPHSFNKNDTKNHTLTEDTKNASFESIFQSLPIHKKASHNKITDKMFNDTIHIQTK